MNRGSGPDRTNQKMGTSKFVLPCALRSAKNDICNQFGIHFEKYSRFQRNPSINLHLLFMSSEQSLETSQNQQGEFSSPYQLERIHLRDSYQKLAKSRGPNCNLSWSQTRWGSATGPGGEGSQGKHDLMPDKSHSPRVLGLPQPVVPQRRP